MTSALSCGSRVITFVAHCILRDPESGLLWFNWRLKNPICILDLLSLSWILFGIELVERKLVKFRKYRRTLSEFYSILF